MEYTWYTQDEPHTAGLYAGRAVLPFLLVANVRAANQSYRTFTDLLVAQNANLAAQNVSSASADARVFPSLPLLNFLGLLLLAVQRGSPDMFRQLTTKYAANLRDETAEAPWNDAIETIAEMYFSIQRPRQSNPLFDMMGSLFGGAGGGGGGGSGSSNSRGAGRIEAPVAEGLD